MCQDWLCERGNNGFCYFKVRSDSIPRRSRDLTEDDWDALDAMHDDVIESQRSQSTAAKLGCAINSLGEEASSLNKQLGEQRFEEMKNRYCEPKPRAARKVTIHRADTATDAANKVRLLGAEFAAALRDALE